MFIHRSSHCAWRAFYVYEGCDPGVPPTDSRFQRVQFAHLGLDPESPSRAQVFGGLTFRGRPRRFRFQIPSRTLCRFLYRFNGLRVAHRARRRVVYDSGIDSSAWTGR